MLRWYYNQSLAPRGDKYRYFKGLEGQLKSDIKFTLADESFLTARRDAINYMKNADSPELRKIELETKDEGYKSKKKMLLLLKKSWINTTVIRNLNLRMKQLLMIFEWDLVILTIGTWLANLKRITN